MFEAPDKIYYKDSEFPPDLTGISEAVYETVLTGIRNGRVLDMIYQDFEDKTSERKILPEVLLVCNDQWYVGAYCYLREEERSFRLDRIQEIKLTDLRDRPRGVADLYRESENPAIPEPDEKWKKKQLDLELCRCAGTGDVKLIQQALAAGADINFDRHYENTPLTAAIQSGKIEAVRFLLAHGADPHLKNYRGETPVFAAARHGKLEILHFLLEENLCCADERNSDGSTPLTAAVRNCDFPLTEYLLEHGADVNSKNAEGCPLLILTAALTVCSENKIRILRILLEHGADFGITDRKQRNILYCAAARKEVELLQFLLRQKLAADLINARDKQGKTPLYAALESFAQKRYLDRNGNRFAGEMETISLLVDAGADIDIPDENGRTPLMIAGLAVFPLLLEKGADLSAVDNEGKNVAIHQAKYLRHIEMLADAGADISARDKYGNNVLLAAEPRGKDVACLIQLYGFSVNDRNQNETILHRAVNASEVATVMYLLENGADVFAVNSNGNTPLQEHLARHPYADFDPGSVEGEICDLLEVFEFEGFAVFYRACRKTDIEKLRSLPADTLKRCIECATSIPRVDPVEVLDAAWEAVYPRPSDLLMEEIFTLLIDNGVEPAAISGYGRRTLAEVCIMQRQEKLAEKLFDRWFSRQTCKKQKLKSLYKKILDCEEEDSITGVFVRKQMKKYLQDTES